jgi:hypothetical protein
MNRSVRAAAGFLICAGLCVSAAQAEPVRSIRRVQVLGDRTPIEIEIESSDQMIPETQVLANPDRLVLDFANAVPAANLRNQSLKQGEVKAVRVSLFSSKPPVTRVVLDLNGAQGYQIFPSGRTVMVKVGSSAQALAAAPGPKLMNANYPTQSVRGQAVFSPAASGQAMSNQAVPTQAEAAPTPPPPPPLEVSFKSGLLKVNANRASLSQVLFAIHERTGAEIAIPAGAEQEQVVADLGPAAAPDVLTHLLNGSKFNFLILSSANDPAKLDRVILSARPEGPAPAYHPQPQAAAPEPEPEPVQPPPPPDPALTQADQPEPQPPAPTPGHPLNPGADVPQN